MVTDAERIWAQHQSSPGPTFFTSASSGQSQQGTATKTTSSFSNNPAAQEILSLLTSQLQRMPGVPPSTLAALERLTADPSVRPADFDKLVGPLMSSLRPSEELEQRDLMDLFRKAGGVSGGALNSGAFTNAASRLAAEQASRRSQLLATNYLPISKLLSDNALKAVELGMKSPEAGGDVIRSLAAALSAIGPLGQTITTLQAPTTGGRDPFASDGNNFFGFGF